jgi:hypothetical protein
VYISVGMMGAGPSWKLPASRTVLWRDITGETSSIARLARTPAEIDTPSLLRAH